MTYVSKSSFISEYFRSKKKHLKNEYAGRICIIPFCCIQFNLKSYHSWSNGAWKLLDTKCVTTTTALFPELLCHTYLDCMVIKTWTEYVAYIQWWVEYNSPNEIRVLINFIWSIIFCININSLYEVGTSSTPLSFFGVIKAFSTLNLTLHSYFHLFWK